MKQKYVFLEEKIRFATVLDIVFVVLCAPANPNPKIIQSFSHSVIQSDFQGYH